MTTNACPPLGTGSIDFARVQQAATKGGDLNAAIAQATTRAEPSSSATATHSAKVAAKTAEGRASALTNTTKRGA